MLIQYINEAVSGMQSHEHTGSHNENIDVCPELIRSRLENG